MNAQVIRSLLYKMYIMVNSLDQFYEDKSLLFDYLFKILYWNSLDLVSIRTLKGSLYISCQSRHIQETVLQISLVE